MSKIEWTQKTWNPIIGCNKVSTGCNNCYAERFANRLACIEKTKEYGEVITNGKWNGKIIVQSHQFTRPITWKKPRMIFVCSMSDLFHPNVPFEIIDDIFSITQKTPQHTYQILTKRPNGMKEYFIDRGIKNPYLNVWLGVSVENQEQADRRIPWLLNTPAAIRFVSCEPLLGKVWLHAWNHLLDWIIVGGESGPGARPMHPDWVRSIHSQCKASGTPFFFKQWGRYRPFREDAQPPFYQDANTGKLFDGHGLNFMDPETGGMGTYGGFKWLDYPEISNCMFLDLKKKHSGNLLFGKEYNEFPKTKQEAS